MTRTPYDKLYRRYKEMDPRNRVFYIYDIIYISFSRIGRLQLLQCEKRVLASSEEVICGVTRTSEPAFRDTICLFIKGCSVHACSVEEESSSKTTKVYITLTFRAVNCISRTTLCRNHSRLNVKCDLRATVFFYQR